MTKSPKIMKITFAARYFYIQEPGIYLNGVRKKNIIFLCIFKGLGYLPFFCWGKKAFFMAKMRRPEKVWPQIRTPLKYAWFLVPFRTHRNEKDHPT